MPSSSLENLQNDGTMYSNDMVAKVINGQLDALSTLEDGSTLNFISAPDNVENNITAQTRKAKRKSTMSRISHSVSDISRHFPIF